MYFRRPFALLFFPNIIIPAFQYAFACTGGIVTFNTVSEILSDDPYNYSSTIVGVMCIGTVVGNFVGWLIGSSSDYVVLYLAKKNHGIKEPEMRLYAMVFPCCFAFIGYMMYGWGAQRSDPWIVIVIGMGALTATEVSTCSIVTSYAMDCFRGVGGELVVVIAMCNSLINFAFSYSVQPFIDATNYGFTGLFFALMVLSVLLLSIPTLIYGKKWRSRWAKTYYHFIEEGIHYNN
ncbi:unnamed protein product [Ambrosiozyma monospora]|uniref:Unnamed protein product n=1 Tax=Ambrosiozyma monospora TaxID=43982 RepID=A0A9W7DL31_AMBMO|nr:unnamed protein product [Ambrosiozyma monospora]